MTPLIEIKSVHQLAGENRRRWFTSTTLDLFVWFSEADTPVGFQFTYDKGRRERAFTWKLGTGFDHDEVDDGEGHVASRYKSTPILRADGQPNIERIIDLLVVGGVNIPTDIVGFVAGKIRAYPSSG
jgi:hypothetical protein